MRSNKSHIIGSTVQLIRISSAFVLYHTPVSHFICLEATLNPRSQTFVGMGLSCVLVLGLTHAHALARRLLRHRYPTLNLEL